MKRLAVRPQPHPFEQLSGYMLRLAKANGFAKPQHLWTALSQADGATHEETLAHAIGAELPVFSAPAPHWLKIPVESHGLELHNFNVKQWRYCPSCLEESNWTRPFWGLMWAATCSKHRCWLADDSNTRFVAESKPSDLVLALGEAMENAFEQQPLLPHPALPMFYQAPSVPDLFKLIRQFSEIVGPTYPPGGLLTQTYWIAAARHRVSSTAALLEDWPNAFFALLNRLMAEASHTYSIKKVFGQVYSTLYQRFHEPIFQGLRDGFELYLHENWRGELCGRNRRFSPGHVRTQPRISFTRAQREFDVGPSTLRSLMDGSPGLAVEKRRSGKREFVTLDREELRSLLARPIDYFDLQALANYLGISEDRVRELSAGGFIPADATPATASDRRWKFRKTAVDQFLGKFTAAQASTEIATAQARSLAQVLQYCPLDTRGFCSVIQALWDGEVAYRVRPSSFSELQIDYDQLKCWLDRWRKLEPYLLTISQAAEVLQLKEQVVYELVAKGLIQADMAIRRGRYFRGLTREALQRFREEYVSLSELAKSQGTLALHLRGRLQVTPATGPNVDGARQYFYRKRDLEDARSEK